MLNVLLLDFAHAIMDGFVAHKQLIVFIAIGCVAGLIAQLVLPGRGHGLVATAIIGIAGCFLGNMVLARFLTFLDNHVAREFVGAIVGAMIVQVIYNLIPLDKLQRAKAKE